MTQFFEKILFPTTILSTRRYENVLAESSESLAEQEAFMRAYHKVVFLARGAASSPVELLELVNAELDYKHSNWEWKDHVYCSQGCNDCCHMNVGVTAVEWDLIRKYAMRHRIVVDDSLFPLQRGLEDLERWALPSEQGKCPFLAPKPIGCRIYPVRPHACRCCYVAKSGPRCQQGNPNHDVHFAVNNQQERIVAAFRTYLFEAGITKGDVFNLPDLMEHYPHHLKASRARRRR